LKFLEMENIKSKFKFLMVVIIIKY
jgi:hypothetical protein